MQVSIPCPNCKWQEINGNFEKYEIDAMVYDMRCTRCNCLFKIKFGIELNIVREGKKGSF